MNEDRTDSQQDGSGEIRDTATGKIVVELKVPTKRIKTAQFSPDGLLLLTTEDTFNGAVCSRLWHCRTYNRS